MKKNIISSSSLAIALLLGASLSASAQYTTFNNSGNFTWNAAPWSAGVPSISPSLSGLIKGGGTITIDSTTTANATALIVGWTGNGTLNVTGGNLTVTGGGEKLTIGASADNVSGILNQSGGTVTAPTVQFALGGFSVLSGTYNLNGGTLAANNVLMHTSNGTGNFNFNGGTLRSTDNGVFSVNATQAVTATVQSGGAIFDTNGFTLVVNSALANGGGGGGLAKNGAGTLTLNATNAYTGATSINAGTLQLGNGGTAGMLSTSSAITNNGTLAINRSDAVVQGTDFSGAAISGTGLFRQAGSGNTTLNIANTYTGGTTLAAGTVIVSAANALSTSGNITFTGGTLQFNSGGVQDYSARIKNSTSAIRINTNGNNATFAGTIDSTNNAGLTKSGLGTLTLNATNNTYTGLSTVSAGTLQIGNSELSDNLGNSSFTVATGATLAFNRNANTTKFTNQSISGAGDVVFNGQSLGFYTFLPDYTGTLTNTGKTIVNYDAPVGGTEWFQRTLWLEKDNVFSNASVLDIQSGKVYLRRQTTTGMTMAGLTGAAGTVLTTDGTHGGVQMITINATSGNYTYAGIIGKDPGNAGSIDSMTLTKSGAGTQILTGANTYNGTTTISAGSLLVNGNQSAATGAVTVASGATLGGNGTIGGATTINGNLRPGNSPGILSFGSNLTLTSTANTTMEINGSATRGTDFDGINVTSALVYDGTLSLAVGTTFGAGSYSFNLFDPGSQSGSFSAIDLFGSYSGSLTGPGDVWSLTSGVNTWTFTHSTGDLGLTVVPEPTTWMMLAFSLTTVMVLRRRRS